jgi:hypothetical protein
MTEADLASAPASAALTDLDVQAPNYPVRTTALISVMHQVS